MSVRFSSLTPRVRKPLGPMQDNALSYTWELNLQFLLCVLCKCDSIFLFQHSTTAKMEEKQNEHVL